MFWETNDSKLNLQKFARDIFGKKLCQLTPQEREVLNDQAKAQIADAWAQGGDFVAAANDILPASASEINLKAVRGQERFYEGPSTIHTDSHQPGTRWRRQPPHVHPLEERYLHLPLRKRRRR